MLRLYHSSVGELISYFRKAVGSVSHINAAKWADVVVVAPATCNTMSKIACGISDSFPLLLVRALARNRKVVLAPSMNQEMWFDPCLQRNVDVLNRTEKYRMVSPGIGLMKSGDIGCGTMASLSTIMETTYEILGEEREEVPPQKGAGSTILVLDSPTDEREHFCQALELRGYSVLVADSRQQARDTLDTLAVDLVVVDLSLCGKVEELSWLARHHTIAISSQDRREAGAEFLAGYNIQFVPKPLNFLFALTLVEGALRAAESKWTQLP